MSIEKLDADIEGLLDEQGYIPIPSLGLVTVLRALLDEHEETSGSMLPGDNNDYEDWEAAEEASERYGESE